MTALPAGAHVEHHGPGRPASREIDWPAIAQVAPVLAATSQRYLDQLALSLRPASVVSADGILRRFAGYLTANHPEINGLVDVQRQHIEGFKRYLPTRPGKNGRPPLSEQTIRMALGTLRTFFERVSEWDYPDAPRRVLIFNGDLPTPDDPLPKFLSDVDAAKLMRAAADADPVRRLVIEMLARTGLRVGEFCALTADAVTKIKGRYWLRVPLGKLHNDRYVPLHPQLVELLDEHRASRDDDIDRLVIWNGGPMSRHQISRILKRIAKVAGIGHVHPHQLRHTVATQAINRGMSLEAIAALLGHKSLAMTLVYARIADRTLADEYQKISHKIEALYQSGLPLPGNLEGPTMRRIRQQHQRMLGNGWCQRPIELDCAFESICETCTYYHTDIEFRLTLERQQDHARTHGQEKRATLYTSLLGSLDKEQP